MTPAEPRFCCACATPLRWLTQVEDGGPRARLRCPACGWTHWNNPTPVLAAVVECVDRGGLLLMARNAAWPGRSFGLVTGFMEAGETPQAGIAREVAEETALVAEGAALIGVYDFQRLNQVIIAFHVPARGEIALSPELAEVKLFRPEDVQCWPAGTGQALADWLRARGIEPQWRPPPGGPLPDGTPATRPAERPRACS
jgi:NAD+ diphosphatase